MKIYHYTPDVDGRVSDAGHTAATHHMATWPHGHNGHNGHAAVVVRRAMTGDTGDECQLQMTKRVSSSSLCLSANCVSAATALSAVFQLRTSAPSPPRHAARHAALARS